MSSKQHARKRKREREPKSKPKSKPSRTDKPRARNAMEMLMGDSNWRMYPSSLKRKSRGVDRMKIDDLTSTSYAGSKQQRSKR